MTSLRFAVLLSIASLLFADHDRIPAPIANPEQIGGPWETVTSSGIDGIYFNIQTGKRGVPRNLHVAWQNASIRVYHRRGSEETGGWYDASYQENPATGDLRNDPSYTIFDGTHLQIHSVASSELAPFDIDVTLAPSGNQWTGTWSRSGRSEQVTLTRPAPADGSSPSPFVGDWKGDSRGRTYVPGTLRVRQSSDGVLSAWLDREISAQTPDGQVLGDARSGELLIVTSSSGDDLALATNYFAGAIYRYSGKLSPDRNTLVGVWADEGDGRMSATGEYHRVRPLAFDP